MQLKAGDKVYCPHISTQVFQLHNRSGSLSYPLGITYYDDGTERFISFTLDGFEFKDNKTPQLFHATPEMKAKLEDLYGIKLEKPPVKPTSREIIQAMLDRGDKFVPCWVSNAHKHPVYVNKWVFICRVGDDYYLDEAGTKWRYATPFDHKTEQPITELPE